MSARARIDGIDFWRGIALLTIFINHVPDNVFSYVTHKNFGFSDAAEAFVFLSGISVALAYGSYFLRGDTGGGIVAVEGPDIASAATLRASGRTTGVRVVGRGALRYAAELALTDDPAPLDPDPADLARLALARHAAGAPLPMEPLYLRRPDAEPPAPAKRSLG